MRLGENKFNKTTAATTGHRAVKGSIWGGEMSRQLEKVKESQ